MSHFSVVVIGTGDVAAQLAPFQENNMGTCPQKYLEFNALDLAVEGYESIEAAVADGYKAHDGKVGHWENPDRRWDWYEVGGRWSGYFPILFDAAPESYGSADPYVLPANPLGIHRTMQLEDKARARKNREERSADWALKKAIDVERKRNEAEKRAREEWLFWAEAKGNDRPVSWRAARERFAHNIDGNVDDYGFDFDAFLARRRRKAPVPFAYLFGGEWFERGRMEMFACVFGEKPEAGWVEQWEAVWDSLDDETRLTCVDCHI